AERARFPGVYGAVVQAGLKVGRLSVALEGLASFARSYAELRRAIGAACVYPLIVLTLAYGLFVLFLLRILPQFFKTYALWRMPTSRTLVILEHCQSALPYWLPVVPVLLGVLGIWWVESGRVRMLETSWCHALGWFPWMRGILENARSS